MHAIQSFQMYGMDEPFLWGDVGSSTSQDMQAVGKKKKKKLKSFLFVWELFNLHWSIRHAKDQSTMA